MKLYRFFAARLREERANSMVENIIVLPLIFIVIYFMILGAFLMHDVGTIDAAARRGAIYAAHCLCDPNYDEIRKKSGDAKGNLDIKESVSSFTFTGIGKNIKPYRYLFGTKGVEQQVKDEVSAILEKTRVPWREIEVENISYSNKNMVFYQDVTVTIKAKYPLPKFFEAFGLDSKYEYSASAKMTVNDPDEFIRNTDLAVDLMVQVDQATGGHLSSAMDKVSGLMKKLGDWLNKFKVDN